MSLDAEYLPSPRQWVRDQVEQYESSGGTRGTTLRDTGLPVVIVTMMGRSTRKVRKVAVMRVEHDGEYLIVASMGGAPNNPNWYYNLTADPDNVLLQDCQDRFAVKVRELDGAERAQWWQRAVAAFPPYAEYQRKTTRKIPVLLATRT